MCYGIIDLENEIEELKTAIVWNPAAIDVILRRIEWMIDGASSSPSWKFSGVIQEINRLLENIPESENLKEKWRESESRKKPRLSFIFCFQSHLTSPSLSPNFPHHKPKRPEYSGLFFLIHLFFYLYPFQKRDLFS